MHKQVKIATPAIAHYEWVEGCGRITRAGFTLEAVQD